MQFFLKGTQLSQLSEEYQTCMENISQTAKVLKRKAEVIPDLEEQFLEAQQRFEEAERAREQRHKADELKKELAWAHVAAKEQVNPAFDPLVYPLLMCYVRRNWRAR